MKKILFILTIVLTLASCGSAFNPDSVPNADSGQIARVEPPCWWSGMTGGLQLLLNGPGLGACSVKACGLDGVRVGEVHKAESPNYLFVDLTIRRGVQGTVYLVFTSPDGESFKLPYTIGQKSSGARESFGTRDMIYLIFPDRFANGDPSNDTVPGMAQGLEKEVDLGRHGGDIQGIIDHLDYIAELGATAIWPTPLLEDDQAYESYHGYAVTDHYRIDPRFGDNELYRQMVAKAHEKGIKVIMDIVTNHCGTSHWWMEDLPFGDWIHQFPTYTNTNIDFSANLDPNASRYDLVVQESGWFVPSMPDMNLDNPYTLRYLEQWAIWWIEFSGLDGIRVDTYPYNEKYPMSRWCEAVLAEYPWINIVGECWTSAPDQLAYWQGGNANKDGFDSHLPSIMDFPLQEAIVSGLCEEGDSNMWGRGLTRVYEAMSHDAVYADLSHMMTFLANHDHSRLGDTFRRNPAKMKMALGLLATMRGIPQLYNGDEMLFCRASQEWNDGSKRADFPEELFSEQGREAAGDVYSGVAPRPAYACPPLHDYTARLFTWRKSTPVLFNGRTMHFLQRDNTYAFFRYDSTDTVFVFVNNSSEPRRIPWEHYAEITGGLSMGVDVMSGASVDPANYIAQPQTITILEF